MPFFRGSVYMTVFVESVDFPVKLMEIIQATQMKQGIAKTFLKYLSRLNFSSD